MAKLFSSGSVSLWNAERIIMPVRCSSSRPLYFLPPYSSTSFSVPSAFNGNGGVEQQVVVGYRVHAAVTEQRLDVLVQFLAHGERMVQAFEQLALVCRQHVGVLRVYGGEMAALHLIFLAAYRAHAAAVVDVSEQRPVAHAPLGVAREYLRLDLELYHRYRLVHERGQTVRLLAYSVASRVGLRTELLAGVVGIMLHGERGEGHEVYAVSLFERGKVGIAQRQAYHVAYAGVVAGMRAHPQYVVVAPLYVPVVIRAQRVHDDVRAGSAVVDVAEMCSWSIAKRCITLDIAAIKSSALPWILSCR